MMSELVYNVQVAADDFSDFVEATGGTSGGGSLDGDPRVFTFVESSDVRGLAFSNAERIEGPLVFAGYGLSVPETDGFSYDSYGTLDVTGKIVVVLRYFPEDAEGHAAREHSHGMQGLRYKAFAARERGAIGLDRCDRATLAECG